MVELEEQPLPENATCPECGAKATQDSIVKHRLSDMGYLHDDQHLRCRECDEEWTLGVPIGTDDSGFGDDLRCSCGDWMLVHRVRPNANGTVGLDLKCPTCKNFETTGRDLDSRNIALVGYPMNTGDRSNAQPYGWDPEGN